MALRHGRHWPGRAGRHEALVSMSVYVFDPDVLTEA
jgi:hypothetical protein